MVSAARFEFEGNARLLMGASRSVGSLLLVVDAKPEAIDWYPRYGFVAFLDTPERLYLPMATIRHECRII